MEKAPSWDKAEITSRPPVVSLGSRSQTRKRSSGRPQTPTRYSSLSSTAQPTRRPQHQHQPPEAPGPGELDSASWEGPRETGSCLSLGFWEKTFLVAAAGAAQRPGPLQNGVSTPGPSGRLHQSRRGRLRPPPTGAWSGHTHVQVGACCLWGRSRSISPSPVNRRARSVGKPVAAAPPGSPPANASGGLARSPSDTVNRQPPNWY